MRVNPKYRDALIRESPYSTYRRNVSRRDLLASICAGFLLGALLAGVWLIRT